MAEANNSADRFYEAMKEDMVFDFMVDKDNMSNFLRKKGDVWIERTSCKFQIRSSCSFLESTGFKLEHDVHF